jgi:phosphate transport system substrate-binding protein
MRYITLILVLCVLISCKRKVKTEETSQTRTAGTAELLVDESFARILDDQIEVFKGDYPDAEVKTILGNENKILPTFLNGKVKLIVLSRMLKPEEENYYKQRQTPVYVDRFAVDGIALITNSANIDSNITVEEIFKIMKGTSSGNKKLVFDNAYSSTVRYFLDSAKVKTLPKTGVYTLNNNNDVIKFVSENKDYIGVVGVNWLLENNDDILTYLPKIKVMDVKGKKASDLYYKPTQNNLIDGVYPLLRNVYIINASGNNGLGTGFANWLCSPRGQLIVLKSGLGPHKIVSRDFNLRETN